MIKVKKTCFNISENTNRKINLLRSEFNDSQSFDNALSKKLDKAISSVINRELKKYGLTVNIDTDKRHCGECGSLLIKRKRGDDETFFFGCSKYPKCKYTESS